MNFQDSLRGVTRRALRTQYESPGILRYVAPAIASSGGSSTSILPVLQLDGPVLTVYREQFEFFSLAWTAIPGAVRYQAFHALDAGAYAEFYSGPLLNINTLDYLIIAPSAGVHHFKVIALEPNFGFTDYSNVKSGDVTDPSGYL